MSKSNNKSEKKTKKKLNKKLLIAGILVIAIAGGVYTMKTSTASADVVAEDAAELIEYTVQSMDIKETFSTSGTVYSKEYTDISMDTANDVTSEIDAIYFEVGDKVLEGDVIAKINDEDIMFDIKNAQIDLDNAESELAELGIMGNTSYYNSYKEAETSYLSAKSTYEGNLDLFEIGAISQDALDSSKSSYDSAYNKYVESGNTLESYNLDNKYSSQEMSVESAEIALNSLYTDLEATEITAPYDGYITSLELEVGDAVTQNSVIGTFHDLDNLEVNVNISEYDIAKIFLGQNVEVYSLIDTSQIYTGVISEIGMVGEVQGSEVTVPIVIDIEGDSGVLKHNFSATTDIIIAEATDALVVPYEAISTRGGVSTIMKKVGDEMVTVEVTEGASNDLFTEVISDEISLDDTVVYSGAVISIDESGFGMMIPGTGGGGATGERGNRPQ